MTAFQEERWTDAVDEAKVMFDHRKNYDHQSFSNHGFSAILSGSEESCCARIPFQAFPHVVQLLFLVKQTM